MVKVLELVAEKSDGLLRCIPRTEGGIRLSDLLLRFLQQNGGKLSCRARENDFAALTDPEVERIEAAYRDAGTS